MPLFTSPYSAEGTPVMTSTDSILPTATLRVPTPSIAPNEALLPMRTPSTSTAVANRAFPRLSAPPSRSEK